jgi:hypothetical protein
MPTFQKPARQLENVHPLQKENDFGEFILESFLRKSIAHNLYRKCAGTDLKQLISG